MLKWNDVLKYADQGNPKPPRRVEKSDDQWKVVLSPEQFAVTRQKGTERPFSSPMCELLEPGLYACACCETLLFDSSDKFQSGTGWPSFAQPLEPEVVAYHSDGSHGMRRVEVTCNVCDAHLGHVFPDGPAPSELRYCINALSLAKQTPGTRKAVFGGGCFWCTEAIFQQLKGVEKVESGYSGGETTNPTYHEVCGGQTGHAEVVRVTYHPNLISYEDLLRVHLSTHNPTTRNRQGADVGSQYRSIILVSNPDEDAAARKVIGEMGADFDDAIVTEVRALGSFYIAEAMHQDYYRGNPEQPYCQMVIEPKLRKFRELFAEKTGS